jgi:hypothetical protein
MDCADIHIEKLFFLDNLKCILCVEKAYASWSRIEFYL